MNKLENKIGDWVLKYRWAIIFVSILFVLAAASGGRFLVFKADYRIFFGENNPELQAHERLEKKYSRADNVLFILSPRNGKVFSHETLSAIQSLTEKAWQIPFSTRVDSITNYQHTYAEGDDVIVEDLILDADELSEKALKKKQKIALNEPVLKQRMISPDASVTAVSVNVKLPRVDEVKELPQVMTYARQLKREFAERHPDIEIRLTGIVPFNSAFAESSIGDMMTLVPLSFAVMFVVLLFLLKSIPTTLGTILVIFMSILTGMGLGGYIGFPLSGPSVTAGTIILTVAIANSVHVLTTFIHEMRAGKDKNTSIKETLRINLQPVFLASTTTMIGFLTMNFSEVPPFRHLGNFVAMGVLASFIFAVTFLPALISVLPVKVKQGSVKKDILMEKLGNFVVARQNILLVTMGLLIVVLITFIPRNELNDVFVHYFDESIQFRQDSDYLDKHLTGLYIIDYSLESKVDSGISQPGFLSEVERFTNWYEKQPEARHVNVYTDVIKRLNKNMHADDDAWYKIPESRELAAQYLLMYEMSLPYGLDLNNQIDIKKSSIRMTVSTKILSSAEMIALDNRAAQWISENAKYIKQAKGTGPSLMFAKIGQKNINSMLIGTTYALVLISGILIFAFRSIRTGIISMIPNLVPAAMGFGLWGLFVGEVGLALSVVTTMTLGIVVDDTVHFLSKYLRARREHNASAADSVRYAFNHVGRALLTTSVVLVAGFLVLVQSSFLLNSGMGMLTAIIILFALIADFFFLPPLLMKLEKKS